MGTGRGTGYVRSDGQHDGGNGEFDTPAGVEVESATDVLEDSVSWDVPAQPYAVLTFGIVAGEEAFDHAVEQWLPSSGSEHAGGPECEFYFEQFGLGDARSAMQAYVSIRRPSAGSSRDGPRREVREHTAD